MISVRSRCIGRLLFRLSSKVQMERGGFWWRWLGYTSKQKINLLPFLSKFLQFSSFHFRKCTCHRIHSAPQSISRRTLHHPEMPEKRWRRKILFCLRCCLSSHDMSRFSFCIESNRNRGNFVRLSSKAVAGGEEILPEYKSSLKTLLFIWARIRQCRAI